MASRALIGVIAAFISAWTSVGAQPSASQDGGATALFRDEIIDAPGRIRWKESALPEETRFAVAVSGLSWRPTWSDLPLIDGPKGKELSYAEGAYRLNAFVEAHRNRAIKIAFAYALSLVLHPPDHDATAWPTAYNFLRSFGADFDKALVGIVAAPERLPLLFEYRHAAADILVYRASSRLIPIYFGLASADDRYIRARGIAGLGLCAYREVKDTEVSVKGLAVEPKELGISAVQISMIDEAVLKAADDRDFRVRAAAALALGLMGGEESLETLRKLMKDKAYIRLDTGDRRSAAVSFPVRQQAALSLERLGERGLNDGSGLYDAKTIGRVVRGGQNITKEAQEAKKKIAHSIRFHDGNW